MKYVTKLAALTKLLSNQLHHLSINRIMGEVPKKAKNKSQLTSCKLSPH